MQITAMLLAVDYLWTVDNLFEMDQCFLGKYINSTFLPQRGCDTRSIFKWSKAGLNSKFSFFVTGCLRKAIKPSLLYLLIAGYREEKDSCFCQGHLHYET